MKRTSSSDRISRNLAHLLRQRSFYPIYPPPDHVCVDYEAWEKYARLDANPHIFITASDLATFNKVNIAPLQLLDMSFAQKKKKVRSTLQFFYLKS